MNSLPRVVRGGLAALVFFSAPLSAGLLSDAEADAEADWKEGEYALPAPPREGALRAFFVSSASPNRFLIDADSLTVGDDGVVRYVLVVRTPGGAENVTFEGIRCAGGTRRIYATGRGTGQWSATRSADWRPIVDNTYDRAHAALAQDYFCDGTSPPRDRAEVMRRLHGQSRNYP